MKNLLRVVLLLTSCLLTRPANSQPVAPLRPLVVRLDSGTTIRRPLIGIDTALYRTVRLDRDLDRLLLANRLARVVALETVVRRDSADRAEQAAELRRCRQENFARDVDYAKLATVADRAQARPTRPPLLLDPHTYKGAGAGALLLWLLVSFYHP